jgi:hypothetical protein
MSIIRKLLNTAASLIKVAVAAGAIAGLPAAYFAYLAWQEQVASSRDQTTIAVNASEQTAIQGDLLATLKTMPTAEKVRTGLDRIEQRLERALTPRAATSKSTQEGASQPTAARVFDWETSRPSAPKRVKADPAATEAARIPIGAQTPFESKQ